MFVCVPLRVVCSADLRAFVRDVGGAGGEDGGVL